MQYYAADKETDQKSNAEYTLEGAVFQIVTKSNTYE